MSAAAGDVENAANKRLDSVLWRACAGAGINIPAVGASIYYFPQGHLEHANVDIVDSVTMPIPKPYVLCAVSKVDLTADPDSDYPFVRFTLQPVDGGSDLGAGGGLDLGAQGEEPQFSLKRINHSDRDKSFIDIPKACANKIFPPFTDKQEQDIEFFDIGGRSFPMTYVRQGNERQGYRYKLRNGWSEFYAGKKVKVGDDIVFVGLGARGGGTGLRIGIIRHSWRELDVAEPVKRLEGKAVVEAFNSVVERKSFRADFYPGDGGDEYCVGAARVRASMGVIWSPGSILKTEASICGSKDTLEAAEVENFGVWPGSPWKLLRVRREWPDERGVKEIRLSPWQAELDESFSPPSKRLRSDQQQQGASGNQG